MWGRTDNCLIEFARKSREWAQGLGNMISLVLDKFNLR